MSENKDAVVEVAEEKNSTVAKIVVGVAVAAVAVGIAALISRRRKDDSLEVTVDGKTYEVDNNA